jgi:hypothetical protein
MSRCPFPAIPRYLAERRFPEEAIADAAITHVWTQDRRTSEHVAAAGRIPHIVDEPHGMIGAVDGVLLARDDAENHLAIAAPFLDAGLPIYIDKPIALSVVEAKVLYQRQRRPGQIFTCSALSYAPELQLSVEQTAALGRLLYVDACVPKAWDTYAVHAIEPLLRVTGTDLVATGRHGVSPRHLDLLWSNGLTGRITALGNSRAPISLRFFGEGGWSKLTFRDSFTAFKAALVAFTQIVRGHSPPQDPAAPLAAIRLLEAGRRLA